MVSTAHEADRRRPSILTVIGTRPEAIKLSPVILALREHADALDSKVCLTSQHRSLVDDVLETFSIVPDLDLDVMTAQQTLGRLTARVLEGMEGVLERERPDLVIVQGDTSTVLATTIAAFQSGVAVAHVEAGLRTDDLRHPFPEEANRRIATVLTSIHLAATEAARQNLLRERVAEEDIEVTGNPGLDALRLAAEAAAEADRAGVRPSFQSGDQERIILVTAHRRESFGAGLRSICEAIARIARARPETVRIVYPVHPNPQVEGPVRSLLGDIDNVTLLRPLPYRDLVALLRRSFLVLTDSGGLQEEAPALGKPVLVMRETTERPEAVYAGAAILVGRETEGIVRQTLALLDGPAEYARMAVPRPIYGDGHAADRIVDALLRRLTPEGFGR